MSLKLWRWLPINILMTDVLCSLCWGQVNMAVKPSNLSDNLAARPEMVNSLMTPDSICWVIRPSWLIFGVFASMTGAGASEKRVTDEQQQRLDCRDLPSDGSRVAPIRGAGVREAGRGVSRGHLPSTPRPIWVMSIASGSGTWRSVAFQKRNQMEIEPNRQEGVL